jgi:hypothetical protein
MSTWLFSSWQRGQRSMIRRTGLLLALSMPVSSSTNFELVLRGPILRRARSDRATGGATSELLGQADDDKVLVVALILSRSIQKQDVLR